MEANAQLHQSDTASGPLVAFDFDGTLTCRDSFMTFLAWRAGTARYLVGLARLVAPAIRYLFDRDRGRLKAAAVREFLRGAPRETLAKEARAFAQEQSPTLLRPDAVARWNAWRASGARLIIVTASPDLFVAPFAEALGADRLIGTRLAADPAGRMTGALEGVNCRGPEKVMRLAKAFGQDFTLAAAYGDTGGDREMLARARERGYRVFRQKP